METSNTRSGTEAERTAGAKGIRVTEVEPESIAQEIGIERGDRLLRLNGNALRDIIDFQFYSAEESLFIELEKENGEIWEIEVEKEYDRGLGLEFEPMKIRQCPNDCEFCFVDQMPDGYRKSLYIRDEDYRFSFLFGNYITLTNLSRKDKERIFEQKLSPLYISVHTTDPELRKVLLKNDHAPPILSQISELTGKGIRLHTQIVLTPGVNDGAFLEKSIRELGAFYPGVLSLAIVPVGLTRYRDDLPSLNTVTPEYARNILGRIASWREALRARTGYPFLFAADEMFILGGVPLPSIDYYEDFPQLENGVGMVSAFLSEIARLKRSFPRKSRRKMTITLVTGTSFYPYLKSVIDEIEIEGVHFQLYPILNDFLGHSVTMTGLISGGDIIGQLKGKDLGDVLLIPSVALNDLNGLFLDDMPYERIEEELGVETAIVDSTARGLAQFIGQLA